MAEPPKPDWSVPGIDLYCRDCMEVLSGLPDKSVGAVVTDPPYGVHAADWDAAIPSQLILDECLRIANGSVLWFGSAIPRCLLGFGQYKPQPDRCLIWAPRFTLSKTSANGMYFRWHPIWCWRLPDKQTATAFDVLHDACDGHNCWDHPATKPIKLMRRIVLLVHGVVLDPYMGSGTTGVACVALGRRFIGTEISRNYFEIAKARIQHAIDLNKHKWPPRERANGEPVA